MADSTDSEVQENILEEANRITHGKRNEDYGSPLTDFTRPAKMWSAILGCEVKAVDVPKCMIALKLSRQCHSPNRDNLVDMCGYAHTIEMCEEAEAEKLLGNHLTETFNEVGQ